MPQHRWYVVPATEKLLACVRARSGYTDRIHPELCEMIPLNLVVPCSYSVERYHALQVNKVLLGEITMTPNRTF